MNRLFSFFTLIGVLLLTGCGDMSIGPPSSPSTLDPRGPNAAHLAELWWIMLALGAAIYLLVVVLLAAALLRGRRATNATAPEPVSGDVGRRWVFWGGIALPLVVLGIVFGYTIYTLAALQDPRDPAALHVRVVGRRWWWDVSYPDYGIVTPNELHIPVGTPVQIQLESADVIHSFWVPELHGKMDLIPSRINYLTLQADHAGVYRGECAEFCGLQHAHMGFMVVAQGETEFDSWVAAQQRPATAPSDPPASRGQQVFMTAGCIFCHQLRGLDDKSIDRSSVDLGPDLTHLSSRLTIAAATMTQNRANLAGWIVDSQHIKPGNLMPNQRLNSEDLQSLLAYLSTLQ
jgi:cytochrome c oxidase subunit 2